MKLDIPVPYEKLTWFQVKIGFGEEDLLRILSHSDVFLRDNELFAEGIYQYFMDIPETRIILGHGRRGLHLKKLWLEWYSLLFTECFNEEVLTYLWKSGLRHVEFKVDKRFINLGYAFVRQFCHRITLATAPTNDHGNLLSALDKMVDFCVLIETHAYVTASSQCDMEVVKGISHQVRNPLTVIGGNIVRLQRNIEPGDPLYMTYETILMENRRLETMVRDTTVYSELYQKEPLVGDYSLEAMISKALKRVEDMEQMKIVKLETALDPRVPLVQVDRADVENMFYYLLQNSLEAADPENPLVHISSKPFGADHEFVEVEIFNTGQPPGPQDMENIFIPFFSLKPYGTGFGLPIARLAARRNLGEMFLEPLPGKGMRCLIQLPVPDKSDLREGEGKEALARGVGS
jgi:signal transduction histidine kinase